MRVFFLAFTLLLTPALFAQTLEDAKAAFDKGEFAQALQKLNIILEKEKDNTAASLLRARANIYLKDYDLSYRDAEKVLSKEPKNALALNVRGLVFYNRKNFTSAINDFTTAISIDPSDIKFYRNRGLAYHSVSNWDKAIEDYSKVLQSSPKEDNMYYNRGIAYQVLKKYTDAVRDYTEVVNLGKADAELYTRRGECYLELRDADKTFADAEQAIKMNPKNSYAYCLRGQINNYWKKYDAAISDLETAVKLDPDDKRATNSLSYVYRNVPNPSSIPALQKKLVQYKDAVKNNKYDYDTYLKLSDLFSDMKLSSEGSKFFADMAAIDSKDVCACYFAAKGYNYPDKKELFDKAMNNYDGVHGAKCSAEAAFWAGRYYADQPNYDNKVKARDYYNLALKRVPNMPYVQDWLDKIAFYFKGTPVSTTISTNNNSSQNGSTDSGLDEVVRSRKSKHSGMQLIQEAYFGYKINPAFGFEFKGTSFNAYSGTVYSITVVSKNADAIDIASTNSDDGKVGEIVSKTKGTQDGYTVLQYIWLQTVNATLRVAPYKKSANNNLGDGAYVDGKIIVYEAKE